MSPQAALEKLTFEGTVTRYPEGLPDDVAKTLRHELGLIESLDYAPYFITVNSIVAFARSRGILCQGRGSAANSAVCFVLGITSIDPGRNDLLFERFVSQERKEPPDIDVDFEHGRREEVIYPRPWRPLHFLSGVRGSSKQPFSTPNQQVKLCPPTRNARPVNNPG